MLGGPSSHSVAYIREGKAVQERRTLPLNSSEGDPPENQKGRRGKRPKLLGAAASGGERKEGNRGKMLKRGFYKRGGKFTRGGRSRG